MNEIYYHVVLAGAAVALVAGGAIAWQNRYQIVGPLLGLAMFASGCWSIGFAHYFHPMPAAEALVWAKITLTFGLLSPAFLFHSVVELVEQRRRFRIWVAVSYFLCSVFVTLLWRGDLLTGIRSVANMDHYVRYSRHWYPFLSLQIAGWQWFTFGVLLANALKAKGYRRTQLTYFIVVWAIVFLTANLIIIPLEYDINIPPFGFFFLPLNYALFAYVMSKARLADFNVVLARVLLLTIMLVVVAAVSLLFIGITVLVAPKFMGAPQIIFTSLLVVIIGLVLAVVLPRWLPRAERAMQERIFGDRLGYQGALTGLIKEISYLGGLEKIFQETSAKVNEAMQLSRTFLFIYNPLSGDFDLQAESGVTHAEHVETIQLPGNAAILRWLETEKDVLVKDELPRRAGAATLKVLEVELDRLGVVVCVPLLAEKRLVGVLALGEKLNREMFFTSDLRVLEMLAAEVALAIRYRRLEDQILHQNKLVELGTIAAGIAHEIRNPLASIRTFAQLLPDKMDDPEFKTEFRQMVLQDVERITKVIQSMLAFSRPGTINIAEHLASDLVEEAVLLVQPRLKSKRIELARQFHEKPTIRVDRQQILQVLLNLLNNAADALTEGGRIRIVTGVRDMESLDSPKNMQRFGVIEVTDNGPGVPAAVRNRLFDPFFTTKAEGTGLGLSISQKIVRDHGGIITVSSIEGKGTSFQVNLPLGTVADKNVQTASVMAAEN